MKIPYEEFDLGAVKTYPLASRKSKANVADFAAPYQKGSGVTGLLASFPSFLAASDFKAIVDAMRAARRRGAAIIWGIGAHVVKTGLSPILIDLMERGFVSAVATNGAGVIHDFEIALAGATSEDVDEALGPGRFGMADETGRILNDVIRRASAQGEDLLHEALLQHLIQPLLDAPMQGAALRRRNHQGDHAVLQRFRRCFG